MFWSTFCHFQKSSFWDRGIKHNFQKSGKIIEFPVAGILSTCFFLPLCRFFRKFASRKEILAATSANDKLGQFQALILLNKCQNPQKDPLCWSSGHTQAKSTASKQRSSKNKAPSKWQERSVAFPLAPTHPLPAQWQPISLVLSLGGREGAEEAHPQAVLRGCANPSAGHLREGGRVCVCFNTEPLGLEKQQALFV